jgi:DNA-binding transcriptional LysR family regulator
MHLSQSSLSRTVKQIETRLGSPLLERDTRNVGLTAEGRELLEIAEDTLACHRDGMTRMQTFLAGGRGTVSIATLPSVAASLLPPVISAFLTEHPDVQVRIHDELSETVLHQVAAGLVDFGITIAPGPLKEISATPLAVDRFYALLRADHPLTARASVSWAELARQPFIALGAESSVRRLTDQAFAIADARVEHLVEARNVTTVGGLVAAGLGVSALPGLVWNLIGVAGLARRPITDPVVDRDLAVITATGRPQSPSGRLLLDRLEQLEGLVALPEGVMWHDAGQSR